MLREPIAAIATSPGRGAVGVVRVSGSADAIATVLVALTSTNSSTTGQKASKFAVSEPAGQPDAPQSGAGSQSLAQAKPSAQTLGFAPRRATLCALHAADGTPIDSGLVIHFPAPHSYTGEDVLELQAHGGPVVLSLLLAHCLQASAPFGGRAARPGEFTERAFLNNKLDLAQAEAVADLIDASTEQAAKSASRSLAGAFSAQVTALLKDLIELRMLVEATLDFPEEEIEHLGRGKAKQRLDALLQQVEHLGRQAQQGSLLREGVRLVIAGQPNVGKSSLLNALAGLEVAIVTPIAGTTRDRVEHAIAIDGIPIHVIDTAGLRDTSDQVERIGIERTWDAVQSADVVLHLRDLCRQSDNIAQAADAQIAAQLPANVPRLLVWNKADQIDLARPNGSGGLAVSAKTGQGLDGLRQAIVAAAGKQSTSGEGVFMARARHVHALKDCVAQLQSAQNGLAGQLQLDLVAEDLRIAQERLGQITGAFSADELLGEIFSRFCIGK
jgi:tRNA modification GTPase